MTFISEDKTQINLPVPLGSWLYHINLDCSDVCCFQKKLYCQHAEELKCDGYSPCHTRFCSPRDFEVRLSNLEYFLENWNTKIFLTYDEAEEKTVEIIQKNVKRMNELGFKLRNDNYSC